MGAEAGMRTGRLCGLMAAVWVGVLAGCGTDADQAHDAASASPSTASTASATTSVLPPASSQPVSPTPVVPVYPPPYIDHVDWAQTEVGPSLRVYPTEAGRRTDDPSGADNAWAEILAFDASADSPGMRAQFDCHWEFARLVDPEKTSWNLEPERPVVTYEEMIGARCNPGFAEEPDDPGARPTG